MIREKKRFVSCAVLYPTRERENLNFILLILFHLNVDDHQNENEWNQNIIINYLKNRIMS